MEAYEARKAQHRNAVALSFMGRSSRSCLLSVVSPSKTSNSLVLSLVCIVVRFVVPWHFLVHGVLCTFTDRVQRIDEKIVQRKFPQSDEVSKQVHLAGSLLCSRADSRASRKLYHCGSAI
jgi:hypothetical protein